MTRHAMAIVLITALSWGCGPAAPADDPAAADPPFRARATVRELMQSVIEPAAEGLWGAVGTISNAEGTVHLEPKTDEDWAAVRKHAIALVESTNLLLMRGRQVAPEGADTARADEADPGAELSPAEIEQKVLANWPAWTTMALALNDAATTVLQTVDARDPDGLLTTGSDLDAVCESCHLTFWYPPPPPVTPASATPPAR